MPTVTVICAGCGSPFKTWPVRVRQGRAKFCKRECKSSREFGIRHFWERVEKTPTCWLWTAAHSEEGYGHVVFEKRHVAAHRLSFELANGPIPNGLFVLHRCDNPPCVNPAHLFLGTHDDNAKDKKQKGRVVALKGEAHGGSKLTSAVVAEMRRARKDSGLSWRMLAKQFGVAPSHARRVCLGESWKHAA